MAQGRLAEQPSGDVCGGMSRSRSRSSERQRRTSAAPRRAWRPSRRSSAGESAPSACADGGAWKRSSAGRGRTDDAPLDLPCLTRRDQLAAERAEQRVGDGGDTHGPQPGEMARRPTEQRIAAERRRNSE